MRGGKVRVEGRAIVVELVQEDAGLVFRIDADIEAAAARLGLARGARVLEHQRHELGQAFGLDLEVDDDDASLWRECAGNVP